MEATLEERVAALEAEVARLRGERADRDVGTVPTSDQRPWWAQRFGAFRDDSLCEEAARLGREYREAQPSPPSAQAENGTDVPA